MPDFTAKFTGGTTVVEWADPATVDEPSRINAFEGRNPRHHTCMVGDAVTVTCRVGGVDAPADAALGGRLFVMKVIESPVNGPVPFVLVGSDTSQQVMTPPKAGHYVVEVFRPEGASVHLHLDVTAA